MSSRKENEGRLIQRVNRYVSVLRKCLVVNTYHPRRRRQRKDHQPLKYSHSLKALAIRDDKIYVVEKPQVPQSGTRIFLDVEGVPDQDFYYLIGLLVTEGDETKAFAFWADNHSEEE